MLCSQIFGVILFHSYLFAVYSLTISGTIQKANSAPSRLCFDCIRSIILAGNNINGLQCLRTTFPYQDSSRYVVTFVDVVQDSFKMSLFFWLWLYCSNFLIPNYFLAYVSWVSRQTSELSLLLASVSPLITDDLLATLPLSVFMVIDVLLFGYWWPTFLAISLKWSYPKEHRFLESHQSTQVLIILELHTNWSPP